MGGLSGCRFCGGKGCLACPKEQERIKREQAWASATYDDRAPNTEQPKPPPRVEFITAAGTLCKCERCECPVKIAVARRADAELLRHSRTTKGVCANCAVTEFLYNTYPANMIIDERGPELLLQPGIAEAFVGSGLMERADMDISEVDWGMVVKHWSLPVKVVKSGRNPYRMGDDKRQKEALADYGEQSATAVAEIEHLLNDAYGGEFSVEMRSGSIVARKKQ